MDAILTQRVIPELQAFWRKWARLGPPLRPRADGTIGWMDWDVRDSLPQVAAPTVVVDLWAPWCGPCRFVSPILEELAREHAGRLKVVKVNVDENPGLSRRYDAMSIPTMLVMRGGKVEDRIVGAMPKDALWARIAPFVKAA